MNYKVLIQYDGTDFHGWQVQENQRTVQGELERVLHLLVEDTVHVTGSGRTDAGVHAEGQVANFRLHKPFEPERLRAAMNGNLWKDVRIMNVEKAPDAFHARFSAVGKTYIYRVINAPTISPFWSRYALHEGRPLNIGKMQEVSRLFLGKHDWTAFASSRAEVENFVRTVTQVDVETVWDARANSAIVQFTVSAEGFLRYMVRSIVGALLAVGRKEITPETVQTAIVTGERELVGKSSAAAHGLTLHKVHYN